MKKIVLMCLFGLIFSQEYLGNENDIVRVNIGDTADIEVDAYLENKFKGIVTEIANSANVSGVSADQVTNFDVKIRMLSSSYAPLLAEDTTKKSPFRPGMSATVDIRTSEAIDVLTVPIQAVTTRGDTALAQSKKKKYGRAKEAEAEKQEEEELKECVFVVQEGKAVLHYVETGIQNTMYIEIKQGIDQEAEVITGPYATVSKKLEHQDAIEVVDKSKLFDKSDD